jgi:hypothetical protein
VALSQKLDSQARLDSGNTILLSTLVKLAVAEAHERHSFKSDIHLRPWLGSPFV